MIVVGLVGVISVIAVPMVGNALANFRVTGDVRGVSNAIALSKMRAGSSFSRVRLFIDGSTKSHHIERLDTSTSPPHWTAEGGSVYLNASTSLSYGVVSTAPPNTQATIGQAPPCVTDLGVDMANSSCILFNSRGVPVDNTGGPPASPFAVYVTNGTAVYSVNVTPTGMIRMWRTQPVATPSWVLQ